MSLAEYKKKRNFKKTSEPQAGKPSKAPIFVVQEHWASHLHYDFRLEAFGVLKSWAVPKGPSSEVGDKRLAVEVEDHPIDYATFKGEIPEGEYGAGKVKIWDHGTWQPPKDLKSQLSEGHLEFELKGKKLKGRWLLQRTRQTSGKKSQWLLIKRHDDASSDHAHGTLSSSGKKTAKQPSKSSRPAKTGGKKQKKDPFPSEISPQLALLVETVPAGDNFIHEMKYDGYRTITQVQKNKVRFLTRSGLDWTEKYKPLDEEVKTLGLESAIFDGEIVANDENGNADFSALQNALKNDDTSSIIYYIFDLLYLNGEDLRARPLEERKQSLKQVLDKSKSKFLKFSTHVRGQGEELFAKATREGLEGIVSKDRNLPYTSGRSASWQKIKTSKRQELIIGGYTDPEGSRLGLGALLMGVYEGKKLRYIGRVGTGFNSDNTPQLMKQLKKLESKHSAFDVDSPKKSGKVHWVQPKLVAEVEFKAWTGDGILRHASFQGLRADKKAKEVVKETPVKTEKASKAAKSGKKSTKNTKETSMRDYQITHPDRIVFSSTKTTKMDLANYYKTVAPWALPYIQNRPLSFLRCPSGAGGTCFFQKHLDVEKMSALKESQIQDQKVVSIDSEFGLLQLSQWGVIEIHPWQSHLDHPNNPDQIVFDLDPDPKVPWKEVVATAERLKDLLERLNLKSFVKTTGGKGLHVQVPIQPIYDWDQIKEFAKTVCLQLESENPGHYTTNASKKIRSKKIFLDYLRNGFGATAVAPYGVRAKERPTVAVPLAWEELKTLKGGDVFDIDSTLKRLARQKKDPWAQYFKSRQKIEILNKTLTGKAKSKKSKT